MRSRRNNIDSFYRKFPNRFKALCYKVHCLRYIAAIFSWVGCTSYIELYRPESFPVSFNFISSSSKE
jgi:hypothetical protein